MCSVSGLSSKPHCSPTPRVVGQECVHPSALKHWDLLEWFHCSVMLCPLAFPKGRTGDSAEESESRALAGTKHGWSWHLQSDKALRAFCSQRQWEEWWMCRTALVSLSPQDLTLNTLYSGVCFKPMVVFKSMLLILSIHPLFQTSARSFVLLRIQREICYHLFSF